MRELLIGIFDHLKGGKISKYKKEIVEINSLNTSDIAFKYQKDRFEMLLTHAVESCSFYSHYKLGMDVSTLPIIDKNIINEKKGDFISSRYQVETLKKVSTSGSTGVPFVVYQDSEKVKRQLSDNFYFSELCGHHLGDRLYYIRVWNEINKLSKLQRYIKNIIPVDTSNLDIDNVHDLIDKLCKDNSSKSILAYSSSLEAIMQMIQKENIDKKQIKGLNCIFTMAEALSKETRATLSDFLQTEIFSRYSNSENGFIAHQLPFTGSAYLINKASFLVETLAFDSNVPVEKGERGRIIITDLFNFAMPMIRYDTGDIGIIDEIVDELGNKHEVLSNIEGRLLDFIFVDDKFISPHTIDYALRTIPGLKQFQLIHKKDKSFTLLLNTTKELDSLEIEKIINKLKFYIGQQSQVTVNFVHHIPLLASGKRKIVIVES